MARISVTIPKEVLEAADRMAASRFETRAEFLRGLIMDERERRADAYYQDWEDSQYKKELEVQALEDQALSKNNK